MKYKGHTKKDLKEVYRLMFLSRKLDDKQFVANAPENVVTHNQNKKNRYENELMILQNNLNSLK